MADKPEWVLDNTNVLYGRLISLLSNICTVNAAITCVLPEPYNQNYNNKNSICRRERNLLINTYLRALQSQTRLVYCSNTGCIATLRFLVDLYPTQTEKNSLLII